MRCYGFFPSIRQSAAAVSSRQVSAAAAAAAAAGSRQQAAQAHKAQSGLSFAREMWRFAGLRHRINARGRNKAERSAIALHRDARPATAPGILTHISLSAFCICRDPYSSFPTGPTGATTYRPPHLFFLCFNKHPYSQPWPPKL